MILRFDYKNLNGKLSLTHESVFCEPETENNRSNCDNITILTVTVAPVIFSFLYITIFTCYAPFAHIFFSDKTAPSDMAILSNLSSKVHSNRKEITKFYNTKCIQVDMYVLWEHLGVVH